MAYAVVKGNQVRVYGVHDDAPLRSVFRYSAWDCSWTAPLGPESSAAVFSIGAELRGCAEQVYGAARPESPGDVMYDPRAGLVVIRATAVPPKVLRSLPGYRYDEVNGVHLCLPGAAALDAAEEYGLGVSGLTRESVAGHAARAAESSAVDTGTVVALGSVLRPYQRAGTAYALRHRKVINADEQGLGKTLQAISALETAGTFPALVACPASLTGNWAREFARWVPGRSAGTVNGSVPRADVVITSYDRMVTQEAAVLARGFRAFVADEAHCLKEPGSQRNRSARRITGALSPDDLVLLMTGTPMPNREEELTELLLMTGTLSSAPGSRATPAWFRERYCSGPGREAELSKFLRGSCMIRRTKEQVLPELPAKQRVDRWVPLDDRTRAEYDLLARDGLARARQTKARAVVYLNALIRAVGEVKTRAAAGWACDFLAGTSRGLVVFAHHKDVQHGITRALESRGYPVARIPGGQSPSVTEREKARFMAGGARVIVCSLQAAGQGHTLTAASDVLTVEQRWNPGMHWQAEDRCHRMGQANAVTAWYLLAEGTIDEWLYELIDAKTGKIRAVVDGAESETGESHVGMLLDRLAERYAITA